MARLIVTIDGPAGSGKSTIAVALSKKIKAGFLDTGAMYRALTLTAMNDNLNLRDENKILTCLDEHRFDFKPEENGMKVCVDGKELTDQIRAPKVTDNVHYIASKPKVRESMVDLQRKVASEYEKIVTEGRDQGTVAFKDATLKIYLDADLDERTRRRQKQMLEQAVDEKIEKVRESIRNRDESDINRDTGPLRIADDAHIIDTTNLTIEQVVERICQWIEEKK